MAKQIKVIKCPQCGSVQKTEIKPEHYRCDNCNTEYILDNDDINVNFKYQNNIPKNYFVDQKVKLVGITICSIFVVIFLFFLFFVFIDSTSHSNKPPVRQPKTVTSSKPTVVYDVEEEKRLREIESQNRVIDVNSCYCSLTIAENKPYIIRIVEREYDPIRSSQTKYFFTIHDLLNNKIIQESEIENLKMNKFGEVEWDFQDFTQDKTYVTANKRTAFLLDKKKFTFSNVTSSLLKNFPQYNTGIASIKITSAQSTNGREVFHILTDDGQKIYYFPTYDKAYVDNKDFYMTPKNFARINDTSEHTAFSFADLYDQDFKLIKYTFISPDGKDYYTFVSAKVGDERLDGSGKFTDEASAYKILHDSYFDSRYQLLSHKNLTPNRLYFDPKIVYYDDTTLIIKTKTSASPDAHYNYQRLDTDNGKVLWTISSETISIQEITRFNDNFIAKQSCNEYAMISSDGTITQEITLTEEK